MNKQNLWFLTLFSLILILGVYYITLPSEIFMQDGVEKVNKSIDVKIKKKSKLVDRKIEREEQINRVMRKKQEKIISSKNSEEKNSAFEELQVLNLAKGKETYLEDKLQNELQIQSFIEINGDNISVTIASKEHNSELANNIMRKIQEEFKDKKNITIKFES